MSIYSRNSENNTSKYPDLIAAMPGFLQEGTKSVVLDCEAVAFDHTTNKILPFQVQILALERTPLGFVSGHFDLHTLWATA